MVKGKFGGDAYKPRQLGPEPSSPGPEAVAAPSQLTEVPPVVAAPPSAAVATHPPVNGAGPAEPSRAAVVRSAPGELEALRNVKVPFSSRITAAAERQLKALSREGEGRSQTELLAEALNLLFKKHGRDQVA